MLLEKMPEKDTVLYGVLPAMIAMPLILRVWTPTWFNATWTICYLVFSIGFVAASTLEHSWNDTVWSLWEAAMFGAVPVSAVVWGTSEHFWMATTVALVYMAYELSELPALESRIGWIAPAVVGLSIIICGLLTINWIIILAVVPLIGAIISSTEEVRNLRLRLEDHLEVAEETVVRDPLTGLINRRGLQERAEAFDGQEITLALIDVDRFKLTNDTHGYQVGDEVLKAIALAMKRRFGDGFELARLGGDEFVAIAAGLPELDDSVAEPVLVETQLHNQQLRILCPLSIGVSSGISKNAAQQLLSEAGFAMRDIKQRGGGLTYFGHDLALRRDRTIEVATIADEMSSAGELESVAQAILSEQDGSDPVPIGYELSPRWRRPSGEVLSSEEFLIMARETGTMSRVNSAVLEQAIEFASRFNGCPEAPFVSVNVAAPQVGSGDFVGHVEQLLQRYDVEPERVMIELTHADQAHESEHWRNAAKQIGSLGLRLVVENFGTGDASFARLQELPVGYLRLDWSEVRALRGPFGEVIGGLARFTSAIGVGLIVEGVSMPDDLAQIRTMGVNTFQGSLFHEAQPLDVVERDINRANES